MSETNDRSARLAGIEGRGYAVLESLPSFHKGLRCTGVFTLLPPAPEALEELAGTDRLVLFEGPLHDRDRTVRLEFPVSVLRVDEGDEEVLVEFATWADPYGG